VFAHPEGPPPLPVSLTCARNSKPWHNIKQHGTPSHNEIQTDWNSKQRQKSNSSDLHATVKFKWLLTPMKKKIKGNIWFDLHCERLPPSVLLFD
jgi:hypothetical protein